MTTQIANEDLLLEKIPNPEGESSDYQETWAEFALTMNGYEVCGDFESCSDLASQVIKEPKNASLTELRCALFFLQRRHRWNEYSDPADKKIFHLLKFIREKVRDGEID